MFLAHRAAALACVSLLALSLPLTAADQKAKKDKNANTDAAKPSYELPQPAKENLDLTMYQLIRNEGIAHSHIMEYASGMMDGIGPRLTGSPNMKRANEWTRDQLTAMGCTNAHLEDWGEFGMGWQQLNTWVRMTTPDTAVFIAQAAPWSPSTETAITAPVFLVDVKKEEDLSKYKGKLAGKIILLGEMREVKPLEKPLFERLTEEDLQKLSSYPTKPEPDIQEFVRDFTKTLELRAKISKFLAEEKALAIINPSRDGARGGGSGGTIFDDSGANTGFSSYKRDQAMPLPAVVMAIENYGRIYRLLKANVPVTIEMNVQAKVTGDHEHGFDTVAEIPGTDPKLKDEVVMVGGHLDSWASGTGATDNGAGSIVAMEAMRILNALHVKPRRTIRIALWSGEEQGLLGSVGYVRNHFGSAPLATTPEQLKLPDFVRNVVGPLQLKPEQQKLSGYFNLDNGSGKVRGVYLQENAAMTPIFQQWIEPLKDLGVTTLSMRNTGGTDHLSFDAVGIPGFQFIQDGLDYGSRTHHSNMDTYERLQAEDLAQAATVEATFVYNAAMRDQMLPRKPLPRPEMEEQYKSPLKGVMPGAVEALEKDAKAQAEQSGTPSQPKSDDQPKQDQPKQDQPKTK